MGGSVGRGGEDERAESACAGRYHAVQRAIGLAPRFPAVDEMAFKATGGRSKNDFFIKRGTQPDSKKTEIPLLIGGGGGLRF